MTCEAGCQFVEGKGIIGIQRKGKQCHKAGNGNCRIDRNPGKKAWKICISRGKISKSSDITTLHSLNLRINLNILQLRM